MTGALHTLSADPKLLFYLGDTEAACAKLPAGRFALIHSDLPFNTGTVQRGQAGSYSDVFSDYSAWLTAQVTRYRALLADTGLLALQLDDREHRTLLRVCDSVMGAENYRGTIIWHYETGGIARQWWSMKHQYIVLYSSGRGEPIFNADAVPTVERRSAPKKVTNARGEEVVYDGAKRLSSVWNINMSTTDPQRCGYPSQKPLTLAQNLIAVHTRPGDWVLDPCCGSGTTGLAAHSLGRHAVLVDKNPQALEAVQKRCSLKHNT
jgi:site-specific DNA-methyltransferase (adenine-specific)